jgi:hypothetical protein
MGSSILIQALTMLTCWRNVALLITLGIALVVLFPSGSGPFTATHGPASALRAVVDVDVVLALLLAAVAVQSARPESHTRQRLQGVYIPFFAGTAALPLRC